MCRYREMYYYFILTAVWTLIILNVLANFSAVFYRSIFNVFTPLGRKKAAGVSTNVTKAAGSAGTPKKKKTSAKHKNNNHPELSDLEETPFDQHKAPPEIMPSLVPHTQ